MKTRTVYVPAVSRQVAETLATIGQWFAVDGLAAQKAAEEATARLGRLVDVYPVKLTATAGKASAQEGGK